MSYYRVLCEHVDSRALSAFKKDGLLKKDRTVGLFYDKSMMQPKFLQQACVEHAPLLKAMIEICAEPPRGSIQTALERLNGQHDNVLFDSDENSDFGSRMQASGLRLMISFISKKGRNMISGERTHPDLLSLIKLYEKCRWQQGVSKYCGQDHPAKRAPSKSPDSDSFRSNRRRSASLEDIRDAFRPSTAGSSTDIVAAFDPTAGSSKDLSEILSSQEEQAAAAEATTAAPAAKPPLEYRQWTDWGLNRVMRMYTSGAVEPGTMTRKLGEAFMIATFSNGDVVLSELPALSTPDVGAMKRPAASSSKKRPAAWLPESPSKQKPAASLSKKEEDKEKEEEEEEEEEKEEEDEPAACQPETSSNKNGCLPA